MNDEQQPDQEEPADRPAAASDETAVTPGEHPTEQITEPVAVTDQSAEPTDWQQRYYRERTLTRIFMATTAAAILLFTGTFAFAVASDPDVGQPGSPSQRHPGDGGRDERSGPGRHGGPGGPGGPRWQNPSAEDFPPENGSQSSGVAWSTAG
jgi:hypothetical protein